MTTHVGRRFWCTALVGSLALLALASRARAQIAVGENVNMVTGRTIPGGDPYLQRQNEPSIAVGSLNANHLLAGANDYRTVDIPFPDAPDKAAGDAWAGVFKSLDGGRTWQSVLLPGYPQDGSAEGAASPLRVCRTDPPAAGSSAPVQVKCVAAADPVVRAGSDGLFYYAGIAFTRDALSSKVFVARFLDGNDKENGDVTAGKDPIRYRGTAVVGTGGPIPASPICPSGAASHPYVFVDKPWIAVDVPRGVGTCALTGKPAGAVYAVYTAFRVSRDCATGADTEQSSDVMFSASYDCGATWSAPARINTANSRLNQGATIAIEPITGRLYVAWRRVASNGQTDAIMATRSHGRKKQFSNPRVVAKIVPFDQGGTSTRIRTQTMPTLAISSDGASSWAHLAWAQRAGAQADGRVVVSTAAVYPPPAGDQDDDEAEEVEAETRVRWSAPAAADPLGLADDSGGQFTRGHQFMPALTFGQGRLVLVWYDSRLDHTRGLFTPSLTPDGSRFALTPAGNFYFEQRRKVGGLDPASPAAQTFFDAGTAADPGFEVFDDWAAWKNVARFPDLQEVRRTLDVRIAFAPPGPAPAFRSAPVTSYGMGFMDFKFWEDPAMPAELLQQLAANPPNLPMFKKGTVAFLGDYIDVAGQAFVQQGGGWAWNHAPNGAPVFHAIWTTNQNVRPPPDGDWTRYTPVKLPGQTTSYHDPSAPLQTFCSGSGGAEGSRNQDIYTSRVSEGLVVSSPQNAKPLQAGVPHGFVVAAQNTTAFEKTFRFGLTGVPAGVSVTFSLDVPRSAVDVVIPPRSSATRSAFAALTAPGASPFSSFAVTVAEVTGCGGAGQPACLSGFVTINPPGSVSSLLPPDGCTPTATAGCDLAGGEVWGSAITNAVLVDGNHQPSVLGPTVQNRTVQNPTVQNPTVQNPTVQNPTVQNPTVQNAVVMNPGVLNPTVQNPTVQNPTVQNPTVQNPTVQNPTVQNAAVSDYSVDVTNSGNTATSYHVQAFTTGTVTVPPLQLIVTRYYLTPFAYGCRLYDVANGLTDVNVPDVSGALAKSTDTADPNVPDASPANVTVFLAPGETKTVTLRALVPIDEMAELVSHLGIAVVPHGGLPGAPTYGAIAGETTRTSLRYDAGSGTFTASVVPPEATGAVTFIVDGVALAVRALSGGAADFRYAPDRGQRVVAFYAGDATHRPSTSGTYTHAPRIRTTTTLRVSPDPAAPGAVVTLTAEVTPEQPGRPTGLVRFYWGTTEIGSAADVQATGIATREVFLPLGVTSGLRAIYSGDAAFEGSTSPDVSGTVAGWASLPSMASPRKFFSAVRIGDRVYAAGGVGATFPLEVFHTSGGFWKTSVATGAPAGELAAAALDGKIYAFPEAGSTAVYDATADAWSAPGSTVPALSGAFAGHAVTAQGRVFLLDGRAVYEYLPASDAFVERAVPPYAGRTIGDRRVRVWDEVAEFQGKIWVIGGFVLSTPIGGETPVRRVDVYDPATDAWSRAADLPSIVPWYFAAAAGSGGKLHVFGGETPVVDPASGRNLMPEAVYDPATDAWTVLPAERDHRYGASAVTVSGPTGDLVLLLGGDDGVGTSGTVVNWADGYFPLP